MMFRVSLMETGKLIFYIYLVLRTAMIHRVCYRRFAIRYSAELSGEADAEWRNRVLRILRSIQRPFSLAPAAGCAKRAAAWKDSQIKYFI